MNGHRCIHCNEMSPEHLALCVTNRYGKPGEDYHTGPPVAEALAAANVFERWGAA